MLPLAVTRSTPGRGADGRGWSAAAPARREPGLNLNSLLLAGASLLLLALAAAMGIVSWHAQYAFAFSIKHSSLAAALEALGLDAATTVFALLGIVLARLGRRAVIERVLVCVCAAGSCAMNLGGADLGSPRSVAVYVMPPVLFAVVSDRLIAVIRRSALGPAADRDSQRSAWTAAGTGFLYLLRLIMAPPSTLAGARRAVLNATPVPELMPAERPAIASSPRPVRSPRRVRGTSQPTKTQRFLALVTERHGPLAAFPLTDVSKVGTALGPEVGLHPGSARTALRAAVLAAQNGDQQ